MNPEPQIECVFPLSVGSFERPALRPPKLSSSTPAVVDVFNEFMAARVARAGWPAWLQQRPQADAGRPRRG